MTKHENEVIKDIVNNIYKATNILDNLNSDFGYVIETSSHYNIINSCREILISVSEELIQKTLGSTEK